MAAFECNCLLSWGIASLRQFKESPPKSVSVLYINMAVLYVMGIIKSITSWLSLLHLYTSQSSLHGNPCPPKCSPARSMATPAIVQSVPLPEYKGLLRLASWHVILRDVARIQGLPHGYNCMKHHLYFITKVGHQILK